MTACLIKKRGRVRGKQRCSKFLKGHRRQAQLP